jgi:hypothetical protein
MIFPMSAGVVSHREELIKIRKGTALSVCSLVNPGPRTCGLAAIHTNKPLCDITFALFSVLQFCNLSNMCAPVFYQPPSGDRKPGKLLNASKIDIKIYIYYQKSDAEGRVDPVDLALKNRNWF